VIGEGGCDAGVKRCLMIVNQPVWKSDSVRAGWRKSRAAFWRTTPVIFFEGTDCLLVCVFAPRNAWHILIMLQNGRGHSLFLPDWPSYTAQSGPPLLLSVRVARRQNPLERTALTEPPVPQRENFQGPRPPRPASITPNTDLTTRRSPSVTSGTPTVIKRPTFGPSPTWARASRERLISDLVAGFIRPACDSLQRELP
jgi:hypothetical protein